MNASRIWTAAALGSTVCFLAAVYLGFVHTFPVEPLVVPCRLETGQVWAFEHPGAGDSWRRTRHALGTRDRERRVPDDVAAAALRCDPGLLGVDDVVSLENGVVEHVTLEQVGDEWQFALRDELRGRFVYRYLYVHDAVIPSAATRTYGSFAAFGICFMLALTASYAALMRVKASRRAARAGATAASS